MPNMRAMMLDPAQSRQLLNALGLGGSTDELANRTFTGTFENFDIYNKAQRPVVEQLEKVADRLLELAPQILGEEEPFEEGKILSIWSPPGRGKSHLLQALINRIKDADPRILSRVAYSTNFAEDHASAHGADPYTGSPILLLDDLFKHNSGATSARKLEEGAVQMFQQFVTAVAENRRFAFITCNFALLEPMLKRMKALDRVGRSSSRLTGLMGASREFELPGKDYRAVLAKEHAGDAADEFTL